MSTINFKSNLNITKSLIIWSNKKIHIVLGSEFPLELPVIPQHVNTSIDYSEWTSPSLRKEGDLLFILFTFD